MTAIVVDTSAVVAILRNEPEKDGFVDAILAAAPRFMSAVSLQEAGMVAAGRFGDDAILQLLDALLVRLDVEIVAHDAALARIAWEAFLRFGRGRHPARLNFGNCAAYALARANDLPLLFKGDGFAKTDIVAVVSVA
ncbi:MAG: ribonuclease VapC [Acetobacteraceae bacterium]|nr:ribonuclease VapC [Acetobacteraceae bacterium]